jgi:DNA-binding response OmpR family regulator
MPADNRVLLLDLRAAERSRLAASISRLGYVATIAEDVAAPQTVWEQEAFAIVIVDVGDQLARIAELQAQLPASAIITIGARSLAAALNAWHAGADGYLPRPVRQNELANTLVYVLRSRATRAAQQAEARREHLASAEFQRAASDLAHQINTPLASILGLSDLLDEELPPEHPSHEYTQAITAAALRIRDAVWKLADIAQLGK